MNSVVRDPPPADQRRAAYERWCADVDALSNDPDAAGKFALYAADGRVGFFGSLVEAFAAAAARGISDRCHIDLVYPFDQLRVQLGNPAYSAHANRCGMELKVDAPSFVLAAQNAQPNRVPCNFVFDSGSDNTLVPREVLERVRAPLVGVRKSAGLTGGAAWHDIYLVSLWNGHGRLDFDPWSVAVTEMKVGIVGRDILCRCRMAYADGGLTLSLPIRPVA